MDFEFTDDQLALRGAARDVLAHACPPALVRAVYEGAPDARARTGELWDVLCGLDWPGLGVPEGLGGLGLGPVEVGIVADELGRVVAPTPHLATVTQLAPLLREAGDERWLARTTGEVTGALAVAEAGRWDLAAVAATAVPSGGGWTLRGEKSHVVGVVGADVVAVVVRSEAGLGAFVVPAGAVDVVPLRAMDPTLGLGTVALDDVMVGAAEVLVEPGDPSAPAVIGRALEEATALFAVSTVATCRAIFEATLQYAKDREQFGRPIGSFQAVKHRLAECYLAVERASALAWFAVLTVAEDDPRRATAVPMAKVAAGECQRLLTRDGLQLHGGIGFTWEHDLHFALKRAAAGELLLGTSAFHRARLAVLLGLAPAREGVA